MNLQSDDMQNIWIERSYGGENAFTKLFTQTILSKEGLKQ